MMPTTNRIVPTVWRLIPLVVAVTAHFRMAPAAINRMLTVKPMSDSLLRSRKAFLRACHPVPTERRSRNIGAQNFQKKPRTFATDLAKEVTRSMEDTRSDADIRTP